MSFQVIRAGNEIGVYIDRDPVLKATSPEAARLLAHELLRAAGDKCPCTYENNPHRWDHNAGKWTRLSAEPPLQEWKG